MLMTYFEMYHGILSCWKICTCMMTSFSFKIILWGRSPTFSVKPSKDGLLDHCREEFALSNKIIQTLNTVKGVFSFNLLIKQSVKATQALIFIMEFFFIVK